MLRLHHSVICAAALALAACTQAPLAPKSSVSMESATTSQDWAGVAHRIAGELRQRGMLVPPQAGATPSASPWGPYYVHAVTPGSAFLQSVATSLKSSIIAAGGAAPATIALTLCVMPSRSFGSALISVECTMGAPQ